MHYLSFKTINQRITELKGNKSNFYGFDENGPDPEFDMDEERTYLNAIVRIRDGFEKKEKMSESMSESMSELERARMQIILIYLETNKEINSAAAAKLLEVEIKTASRLLLKAEKLNILKGTGKTKNKVYKK